MTVHQGETYTGEAAKKFAADRYPFGAGFSEEVVNKTHTVEVWHSSFDDPGGDFNLFKAYSSDGNLVAEQKRGGY